MTDGAYIHDRDYLSYALDTPLTDHDADVRFQMTEGNLVKVIGNQRNYPSMPLNPCNTYEGGDPTYWLAMVPARQAGKLALVEFGVPDDYRDDNQTTMEEDAQAVSRDLSIWQPVLGAQEAAHFDRYRASMARRVAGRWGQRYLFAALERHHDGDIGWTELIMSKQLDRTYAVFQNVVRSREAADLTIPHWLEKAAMQSNPRDTARTMALRALSCAVRDRKQAY